MNHKLAPLLLTLSATFLGPAAPLLAAEDPIRVVIQDVEDTGGLLASTERERLVEYIEQRLTETGTYKLVDRNEKRVRGILKEVAFDESGLTKGAGGGMTLFEVSDAILFPRVRFSGDGIEMTIRLIKRDMTKQTGIARLDRTDMEPAVRGALDRIAGAGKGGPGVMSGSRGYVLRSAIVPGWGEYARGDRVRGAVYLGGFALAGTYFFSSRSAWSGAKANLDTQSTLALLFSLDRSRLDLYPMAFMTAKQSESKAKKNASSAQSASILMLTIYLCSIADAAFLSGNRTAWEPSVGHAQIAVAPLLPFERRSDKTPGGILSVSFWY